jgi:hypothetical protein
MSLRRGGLLRYRPDPPSGASTVIDVTVQEIDDSELHRLAELGISDVDGRPTVVHDTTNVITARHRTAWPKRPHGDDVLPGAFGAVIR